MEVEAAQALAEGLKLLGAGLAMTGAIGAGAGVGIVVGGAVQGRDRQQYVVASDGQRFLMSILPEDERPSPITVILNFKPNPNPN